MPVRRVVTGLDARGESTIVFDGEATTRGESPDWPGMGVTLLWKSAALPADNSGNADAAAGPLQLMSSPLGAEFLVWQCPPLRELDALPPEQRARALSPGGMIEADRTRATRHPGMHATSTLDFLVVLSGEVTLLLENGETTLHAGDTVVDRGVVHAWENRGEVPALLAIVNLGALPLNSGVNSGTVYSIGN
jgi:mannose-6-phosphate isomerase-like protein (cupin superfamily)